MSWQQRFRRGKRHMRSKEAHWVVLFGGADREGVVEALLGAGVDVTAVLVPERRSARLEHSVQALREMPTRVIEVDRSAAEDYLTSCPEAALLSVGFPYVIGGHVLATRQTRLNVHPTLLPHYRGPTSGAYQIMDGQTESGSTVHVMESGVDTGAIVAQSRVKLDRFDTVRSVQRKVYETEPRLLLEALALIDGGAEPVPQTTGSVFPRRGPKDSEIDPNISLVDLYDTIRSCDPEDYPAFFFVDGEKVCVRIWRPDKPSGEEDRV